MNVNLKEMEDDFLKNNPQLISLNNKQNKIGVVGFTLLLICFLSFTMNLIFLRSIPLGIAIVIIPLAKLIFIDKFIGFPNLNSEFDKEKGPYVQRMLDSMGSSSLKFNGNIIDLDKSETEELGFIHHDIEPTLKFVKSNCIAGTYKNLNVKFCELSVSTQKGKMKRSFPTWQPSTLIVLDNMNSYQKERVSIYLRKSLFYSKHKTEEEEWNIPVIEQLREYVKLDGVEVKTGNNIIDEKYLILKSTAETESISRDFIDRFLKFDKNIHHSNGKKVTYNVKFLTLYKDKIVIVIFNQTFLKQRMEGIFKAYNKEINSILSYVDIFVASKHNEK